MKRTSLCSLLFAMLSLIFFSCNQPDSAPTTDAHERIWFQEPARAWEEALPLGNGRLGIMVFGHPTSERIQLNDDSLWPADQGWDEPAGTPADLQAIREALFAGDHVTADRLFVEKFSNKSVVRSHQTLGDLFIDFAHDTNTVSDYRRELDLEMGIARTQYRIGDAQVTQEAFVSHPDQVIVLHFTSESSAGLNARLRLTRPEDEGVATVETSAPAPDQLIMRGQVTQRQGAFRSEPAPILEGVQFETLLKVLPEGGSVEAGEDFLEIKGAGAATLLLVSNSSFYVPDPGAENRKQLAGLAGKSLAELREAHVQDHQSLYKRLDLKLANPDLDTLPTPARLARIKEGQIDPHLEQVLFQYGRYLLIGSSRPGTNPANLQGLWNPHINAPWNADYHLNINLQMNYWLADMTGLGELNEPLFDYVDRLVENGKTTARVNFGCRGSFIPHATDLWAPTWLRAPTAYWGCSVGAGGWLMQHYWEHFAYTGDTTFLQERVLPALTEVAQFYSDWLITDPRDGSLISAPSTSPENRFYDAQDNPVATCLGSAMDQQVIEEVFRHYLQSCELLELETELQATIEQQYEQLRPGFVLGSDGRILEWDREYEEPEPGHRHMSHLYGFHPGTAVTKAETPELFAAVRRTLDYRLDNGGAGTGWSRAWLINCAARLLDAEMAHEHIQLLFRRSMFDNLFDAHPPFQIDGNFGFTSGVAEMLLQSHEPGIVRLLPALPDAWPEGYVKGIRARGGLELDLQWESGGLTEASLRSPFSRTIQLIYGEQAETIELKAGEEMTWRPQR